MSKDAHLRVAQEGGRWGHALSAGSGYRERAVDTSAGQLAAAQNSEGRMEEPA